MGIDLSLRFGCKTASSSGFPKYLDNRLTRSGPEVTNQAENDDCERHEVQPEWPVVLQIHKVTWRPGRYTSELDVRIGIDLDADQTLTSWEGWSLLTKQETEKVFREQVEVTEHGACQSIDDWSRRVQDEHCGGKS